jgi:hypothetical protein
MVSAPTDWSNFTVEYPQLIRELDNACHRKKWELAIELCAKLDDITQSVRKHVIVEMVNAK